MKEIKRITPTFKKRKTMNPRNLSGCFPVVLLVLILAIPSHVLCAGEDTAYLTLKKTATSKRKLHTYVVKKGDTILNIIRRQFGAKDKDVYKILKIVKHLNPKIKNANRIHPGQKLLLPGKEVLETTKRGETPAIGKGTAGADVKMEAKPSMSAKNHLPVIRHAISQLDGSVTTTGNYYIPIPPAGQITVNCSTVPVVELYDGSRVLLDFSSQIPEDLKRMIESTWRNYSIISNDRGILSVLEKIISTSKTYSFRKFGEYVNVGENPKIKIWLEWLVSNKISTGGKPCLHGLNLVKDRSQLLPQSIKKYAEKNNLTITEIIAESRVASATDEAYTVPHFPTINSGTNRELVDSLLTTLGYTPSKNAEVKIFDSIKDGFDMSVKADLLLRTEGKCVIINFKKLSQQFINIFKERGTKIVFISEGEQKKMVVQKVLYTMNIPFSSDDFKFSIPQKASNPRTIIYLPAIKMTKDKSSMYLTDSNIDSEIYGLLHRKWGVNLVKY